MGNIAGDSILGMKIYGIAAAQNVDSSGETILIEGIDTRLLTGLRDEHEDETFFGKVGKVTGHKKIFKAEDCESEFQVRAWNHAQVPFLYVEGELLTDVEQPHPNALAAASWIKYSQRSDTPGDVGFSIDGSTVQRQDHRGNITEDKNIGKVLSRTVATDIALTVKPCNPICRLWMVNDLTKSELTMEAPAGYMEALKKSSKTSFNEIDSSVYYLKTMLRDMERLHKSVAGFFDSASDLRCNKCGDSVRVFKSAMPNRCTKCDSTYSMAQLWNAINKKG